MNQERLSAANDRYEDGYHDGYSDGFARGGEAGETEARILTDLRDTRVKMMQNGFAVAQGLPAPHPELLVETRLREVERERQTYMYGYGLSFQDDREFKAFQDGRLKL